MPDGHLVFVPSPRGYELREREGDAPALGATLEEDGKQMHVTKVAPSPLPHDDRVCVYVQAGA